MRIVIAPLAATLIAAVALTLATAGCIHLPEYVVSVQADPDVTWWGYLKITRSLGGGGEGGRTTRVPQEYPEWDLDSWETTLEHKEEDGLYGRITAVAIVAYKTGGEGFIRVMITRDGEVVAQGETSDTGAGASCEFAERN